MDSRIRGVSKDSKAKKDSLAPSLSGGLTEGEIVTIEKLVYGGQGMGRLNGRPVFVPHVLPGETVKVEINRRRKDFFEAALLEVTQPAKERVHPPCPYFGGHALRSPKGEAGCGGCQWQHIAYETQLEWKQKILAETLIRIGKIENPNVLPAIPSPKQLGWRSRVTVHADGNGNVGFFAEGTHRVVDIEECLIVEEAINGKIKDLREKIREKRDYELRTTEEGGFTQVNREQNENLKSLIKEWSLKLPHESIVELFCGSGNFTEVLIPLAKKIIAIDSDREAIQMANQNLSSTHQHINTSTQFLCTDALRFFSQKLDFPLDLLVLDPPRDGAAGVVEGVIKNQPQNILYISCNPATLARDLKFLKEFANYHLVQSKPIDMFPQSYHIESLNWITCKLDFGSKMVV